MNQNSEFLSSATLKDKAKDALTGNYGKMILAALVIGGITYALQFTIALIQSLLFNMYFIVRGFSVDGITQEQMQILIMENAFEKIHQNSYTIITYTTDQLIRIPITVFNIGLSLCCLNLACGQAMKISDVFYGFRNQFSKSLKLATVLVLLGQLYNLPGKIITQLAGAGADWQTLLPFLLVYIGGIVIYIILNLNISQVFLLLLDFPDHSAGELIKLSAHIMKGHKARLFYIQLSFIPLLLLSLLTVFIGNLWLTPYMNLTYTFFFLNLMQAREKSS